MPLVQLVWSYKLSVSVAGFDRLKQSCKGTKLCIPSNSPCDFLVWEMYADGLAGHFGKDKTIALVEDRFY